MLDLTVAELLAGHIYVNLHTEAYPSGDLRGQLDVTSIIDGDVNRDGSVDIKDVFQVVRIILSIKEGTPDLLLSADVNLDGQINRDDIRALVEIIRTEM